MAKKKEVKKEVKKDSKIKLRITAWNMAGKYGLPHSFGNIDEFEEKQALELIEAGDAEKV